VSFHDKPGVADLLILASRYEASVLQNWQIGTKVQAMFDQKW
jgi:hypothetical protein